MGKLSCMFIELFVSGLKVSVMCNAVLCHVLQDADEDIDRRHWVRSDVSTHTHYTQLIHLCLCLHACRISLKDSSSSHKVSPLTLSDMSSWRSLTLSS